MSTLQKVNSSLNSIIQGINCPITLEPMLTAYSMLPCNHKVSQAGKALLEKQNPILCPLDRKKITHFVEDKDYRHLVEQTLKLAASIQALNNELSESSKLETTITKEQGVQSMEFTGPMHSQSKISKSFYDSLEVQSPRLTDPLPNLSSIDKNNPAQVLKALGNEIQKLKTNATLLTEPLNHSHFLKILDFSSKILTHFPSESLFCNLVYKHAYWVTLQNAEIDTQGHSDFGKVSVLDNMLPSGYYKDIFYRATIEFYLHYFSRMSTTTPFRYDEHQEFIVSTFKEHLSHDGVFFRSFVESITTYSKEHLSNDDLVIRCFLFSCYGLPKGDLKLHEYVLKKAKEVWEKH